MSDHNIGEEEVEIIEKESEKIGVLNADGVNVETLSMNQFEEFCEKMKRKENPSALVQALYFPKHKKIVTFKK